MRPSPPAQLEFLRPTWLRSRLRAPEWLLQYVPPEHVHDVAPHDPAIGVGDKLLHNVKQLRLLHQGPAVAWLYVQLHVLGVVRAWFLELWQLMTAPEVTQEELWLVLAQVQGMLALTGQGLADRRPMSLDEMQRALARLYFAPRAAGRAWVRRTGPVHWGVVQPTHCFRVRDPGSNLMLTLCALLQLKHVTGTDGHVPVRWLHRILQHGSLQPLVQEYRLDDTVQRMLPPFRLPVLQADSRRLLLESKRSWPPLQDTVKIELQQADATQLGLSPGTASLPDVAAAACLRALGQAYHQIRARLDMHGISGSAPDGDEFFLRLFEDARKHGLLETDRTRLEDRLLRALSK